MEGGREGGREGKQEREDIHVYQQYVVQENFHKQYYVFIIHQSFWGNAVYLI